MTAATAIATRIAELDRAYWTTGESPVSDAEYDALKAEYLAAGGADAIHAPSVRSAGKIRHERPMLSMAKAFDVSEILAWARSVGAASLTAMPKFDGVALVKYADGTVATRGDGEIGDIVRIPSLDSAPAGVGEGIVRKSVWREAGRYSGCRSMVSAVLLSAASPLSGCVEFVRYEDHAIPVATITSDALEASVEELCRTYADYPMDGIVFRIADSVRFDALGRTDHHWRGQIALKFKDAKEAAA